MDTGSHKSPHPPPVDSLSFRRTAELVEGRLMSIGTEPTAQRRLEQQALKLERWNWKDVKKKKENKK